MPAKKSLGQHWLTDRAVLASIASSAKIEKKDTVLEIGPGLGTLTSELLKHAKKVVAVELDAELANKLPGQFPGKNLEVFNEDILQFNLNNLPRNYVVVANVPYYITSKIVNLLMTADNKPKTVVLLIQKEVAQRLSAAPGDLSILAISAQVYADVSLGIEVPAKYFSPPPKVDSQVVILNTKPKAMISTDEEAAFFRVVKAGFSAKRKKLRSSISGGLNLKKTETEDLLKEAEVNPDSRAEDLSIEDWLRLARVINP